MMDVRLTWNDEVPVPPGVERDDNGGRLYKTVARKGRLHSILAWPVSLRSSGMLETEARIAVIDDRDVIAVLPLAAVRIIKARKPA